jgi:hypothetical protein
MTFYKMGHEAPEWPRSNLGSFELGAPDPILLKFKPSSIFTKISKVILNSLTPEFALEISKFQNSEYEVHQSSPTDEG